MDDSKLNKHISKLKDVIQYDKKYLEEEGIEIPNAEAINNTINIFTKLADSDAYPNIIATTVEEGIALIFEKKCERMYVEVYNTGELAYLIEDKKEQYLIENEEFSDINEAIERIKKFHGKD